MDKRWILTNPKTYRNTDNIQRYGATVVYEDDIKGTVVRNVVLFSSNLDFLKRVVEDHNTLIKYKEKFGEIKD